MGPPPELFMLMDSCPITDFHGRRRNGDAGLSNLPLSPVIHSWVHSVVFRDHTCFISFILNVLRLFNGLAFGLSWCMFHVCMRRMWVLLWLYQLSLRYRLSLVGLVFSNFLYLVDLTPIVLSLWKMGYRSIYILLLNYLFLLSVLSVLLHVFWIIVIRWI